MEKLVGLSIRNELWQRVTPLLLRSSAICPLQALPFLVFGWERPGGAVDAESFPWRIERIHYLCPEVTI